MLASAEGAFTHRAGCNVPHMHLDVHTMLGHRASYTHLQALLCTWTEQLPCLPAAERQDIVYVGNRIRQKGESNGKACNLNNTLRNLYPPGQPVDPNEVGWGEVKAVRSQAGQLPPMSCAGTRRTESLVDQHMRCNITASMLSVRQEAWLPG